MTPDGVPSSLRIDPITGLPAPPAYLQLINGAYEMGNSLTVTAGNPQPLAADEGAGPIGQGFEIATNTIQQVVGFPYKAWFRPRFNGRFAVSGGVTAYATAVPLVPVPQGTFTLFSRAAPIVPLAGTTVTTWISKLSFSTSNAHLAEVGPMGRQVDLSSSLWYFVTFQTSPAGHQFDFNDTQFLTLLELL